MNSPNKTTFVRSAFLVLLAAMSFIVNLGIFEPDLMEARNFVTAREILQNDQWLLPTMNGSPRLEKPPFPTWLSAFNMHYFGSSMFSLRLPGALMACLMMFFVYRFGKYLNGNERSGFIAAVALSTMPMVIQMGRTGSWDIFCQALMLGGIYHAYRGVLTADKANWKHTLLGALFIGLSAMSKGPVAVYAMLLPFLLAYFIVYKNEHLKGKAPQVIALIVVSVLVSVWWYLYAKLQAPEVSAEIAAKEIKAWSNRHRRPFYFYLGFPAFAGIWAVFMVSAFFTKGYKRVLKFPKKYLLTLLWTIIAVILLSVIPEKKERYLLPVFAPMALLIAQLFEHYIQKLQNQGLSSRLEKITLKIFNGLLVVVIGSAPVIVQFLFVRPKHLDLASWIIFSACCAVITIQTFNNWKKNELFKQLYSISLIFMVSAVILYPALPSFHYKHNDFKNITEIKQFDWYGEYNFYTDIPIDLKAIWRIGKEVRVLDHKPESNEFVYISEKNPPTILKNEEFKGAEITALGNYDYFRRKSHFRLYISKVKLP